MNSLEDTLPRFGALAPWSDPGLAERARERGLAQLREALGAVLGEVDDALFDFAEKSASSAVQTVFFDAMRELRLERARLEENFVEALRRGAARDPAPGTGALALVGEEAMEEDVAVAALVAKCQQHCAEALYALDQRFGWLAGQASPGPAVNPLSPGCVGEALRAALAPLQAGIRVRLVVLKLFERRLPDALGPLYEDLNTWLAAEGVRPDLRLSARRLAGQGAPAPANPASGPETTSNSANTVLGELQQLLSEGLARLAPALEGARGAGAAAGSAVAEAVETLSRLQRDGGRQRAADPVAPAADARGENLLRALRSEGRLPALDRAGDLTLDLVAVLFDYLLEDQRIPAPVRGLLARLQLPMVKVALLDPGFFSRRAHPARRLLSGMAETGTRLAAQPGPLEQFCATAQDLVQRVLDDFDQDLALIAELADRLEAWTARDRQEGSAADPAGELERRLAMAGPPAPVAEFLRTHWARLVGHGVRAATTAGEDPDAPWQTLDDLLWSVAPKPKAEERRKLSVMLPGLLRRLRRGMDDLELPRVDRSAFMAELARIHTQVVRGAAPLAAARAAPAPASPVDAPTRGGRGEAPDPRDPAGMCPGADPGPAQAEAEPEPDSALRAVEALRRGDWLHLQAADGREHEARLSWVLQTSGFFLFTDRDGNRLARFSRDALVTAFRQGQARLAGDLTAPRPMAGGLSADPVVRPPTAEPA